MSANPRITCEQAHRRAFSVAAAMPAALQREVQSRIDHLLETGASFDEAKRSLQPLFWPKPAAQKEPA